MNGCLLALVLLTSLVSYSQNTAPTKSSDQQQLLTLEADLVTAENKHDAGLFERVVGDDWVNASPTGQTRLSKAQVVASLRQVNLPYQVTTKDTVVHIFGNAAVLTFTKQYTNNEGATHSENVVHVLTRENNDWKLRFSQSHSASSEVGR